MDEIQQILENSKLTEKRINAGLRHPTLKTVYKPREVFGEITHTIDTYFTTGNGVRALGYAGLRGTGKTTLLWQAANHIYKNYTQNIYFFNIQDLAHYNIGVWELKDAFKKYIVKDYLETYEEKIVLVFDEVHEASGWAKALKVLYDEFRIAFILASGSSALLLQSTADLVTRMLIQHVFPLNFREYMSFIQTDKEYITEARNKLEEVLIRSENIEKLSENFQQIKPDLDRYLNQINDIKTHIANYIVYRNIIRFLYIDTEFQINEQIKDLVRRVIFEDIPKLSDGKSNPQYAEKILRRLAASDEINIQPLSQSMGISQKILNENLDILVKAELLNVLYSYGGIDSKINKMQKFFFMSPSIRKAILTPILVTDTDDLYAKMLEDIVVLYLHRIFRWESTLSFSSVKGQKNPDLIIETLPKPILLEIGIGKRTSKQITNSKIKYKYGIIISSKSNEISYNEADRIIILPLKYFLLL